MIKNIALAITGIIVTYILVMSLLLGFPMLLLTLLR